MAPKSQDSGFRRPSNEDAILPALSKKNQKRYMEVSKAAAEVAAEHPELDARVNSEFLHDYLIAAKEDNTIIAGKMKEAEAKGMVLDGRSLQRESNERQNAFLYKFQAEKLPKYGPSGKAAFHALGKELQGPSIFSAAANQIYNKNEGGWQLGGILGLLVGGFLANRMIPGGLMGGGLFGILGALGLGFMGAWLGNKGGDVVSGLFNKKEEAPAATPAPAAGKAPTVERAPAEPEPVMSPEAYEDALRKLEERAIIEKQRFESQEADGTNPVSPTPSGGARPQPKPGKTTPPGGH